MFSALVLAQISLLTFSTDLPPHVPLGLFQISSDLWKACLDDLSGDDTLS